MSYNDAIVGQPGPSSQTVTPTEANFVRQFRSSGGTLNPKCKLVHYETMGTGLVASERLEEGDLLFSVPRHMLLNLKNSILSEICRRTDGEGVKWDDVNGGWLRLMLAMMWERFKSGEVGSMAWSSLYEREKHNDWLRAVEDGMAKDDLPMYDSTEAADDPEGAHPSVRIEYRDACRPKGTQEWGFYFDILPQHFDTPMFWNEADMHELKGTNILNKIGKEEATKDYFEKVRPFILSRPHIFFGSLADGRSSFDDLLEQHYSLEQFHIMGSRILSRSFHVKDAKEGVLGEEGKEYEDRETRSDGEGDSDDSDDEEQEEEDIEAVSMVPMADMLNARFGCDNAHLFYKPDRLEMRATQRIEAGEQVWNTYGDPPSSDLLRRYGYVDLGNVADVVELSVQDLLTACLALEGEEGEGRRAELLERIQWACSLGLDEEVALNYPFPPSTQAPHRPQVQNPTSRELKEAASDLPEELLIMARLLCLSDDGYGAAKKKEKLPRARIDAVEEHNHKGQRSTMAVAELIVQAIEERKRAYATSVEEDERLLYGAQGENDSQALSTNKRNALVVRLSEKRILAETQKVVAAAMDYVESKKRHAEEGTGKSSQNGGGPGHKKARKSKD